MLRKSKDKAIKEGIVGKYVKIETPPVKGEHRDQDTQSECPLFRPQTHFDHQASALFVDVLHADNRVVSCPFTHLFRLPPFQCATCGRSRRTASRASRSSGGTAASRDPRARPQSPPRIPPPPLARRTICPTSTAASARAVGSSRHMSTMSPRSTLQTATAAPRTATRESMRPVPLPLRLASDSAP